MMIYSETLNKLMDTYAVHMDDKQVREICNTKDI
jgi:hypothetical protein